MNPRTVELELQLFRCLGCSREFTHAVFVADTDVATNGLCAASSREALDVTILETTAEEWADLNARRPEPVERCVAVALGRSDFFVTWSRFETAAQPELNRMSIQEFNKAWKPPRQWLSSPCCPGVEASQVETMTLATFVARGGSILAVDGLKFTSAE